MKKFTKTLLLFSLLIISLVSVSCKDDKEETPAADLTTEAVGKYKATKISYDGENEDVTGMGYNVEVVRVKENVVTLKLDVGIDFDIEDVPLTGKSGAIAFTYKEDGDSVNGTIAGNKLKLTLNAMSMTILVEAEK